MQPMRAEGMSSFFYYFFYFAKPATSSPDHSGLDKSQGVALEGRGTVRHLATV
jgi:hypothetical protein